MPTPLFESTGRRRPFPDKPKIYYIKVFAVVAYPPVALLFGTGNQTPFKFQQDPSIRLSCGNIALPKQQRLTRVFVEITRNVEQMKHSAPDSEPQLGGKRVKSLGELIMAVDVDWVLE
ncbi:hypothetical protein OG21DRAFT_1525347 [Imleria badia]|nr:hypothetical protein OG21DRAFT_1525347 [Imleria badia]